MKSDAREILRENRRTLLNREASLKERRLALLWDRTALCGEVSLPLFTDEEQLASVRDGDGEDRLSPEEKVRFAALLARRAGLDRMPAPHALSLLFPAEGTESPSGGEDDTVAYLRSSYADRAFRAFSPLLSGPRAIYPTSFAGVCEEVYYNRARRCILPIENSGEGSLRSFRLLIGKYELKIAAVCDVPTSEESVTRFALLQKNVRLLPKERYPEETVPLYFRFNLAVSPSDLPLDELLMAMRTLGLTLLSTESVPLGYSDRAGGFEVTAQVGQGDLGAFLAYLFLFAPQFEAAGIYPEIGS